MKWMLIALFIIFSSACSQAPSGSKETAAELASRAAQENFEVIIEDAASLADPNFEPQEAFQIEASAIPQNAALVEQMLGNTPISGDKLSATHHIALLPTAESIDGLYNAQEIQVRLKRDGTVIALGILPREQIDAGERSVSVTTKTLVVNTMAQKLGMTYDNLLPLVNNEITSSFQAITAAMNFDSEKPPSFTSYVSLLKDYATKIAWTTETVKTAILSAGVKRKTLLTSMPLFDDARLRADFTSLLGSEATDQILHSMASATTAATDEDTSK